MRHRVRAVADIGGEMMRRRGHDAHLRLLLALALVAGCSGPGSVGGFDDFGGSSGGSADTGTTGSGSGANECTDGELRVCGTDEGLCESGVQGCLDGQWGECVGEVAPTDETCNGE
ncbi:MAG: hypothetical protein L0206_26030, partial [Actinobacteria bacterium]|nr:hypothetical protein [Actinomycetota bacterium]